MSGTTDRLSSIPDLTTDDLIRFWSKVERFDRDSCWIWKYAAIDSSGYGRFSIRCQYFKASRISYFIHHKIDPKPYLVLHDCNRPACVNPRHLYLGDESDNMIKRSIDGRLDQRGSGHPSSKLDDTDVVEIKRLLVEDKISKRQIAIKYGVSSATIDHIDNGTVWSHIPWPEIVNV